MSNNLNSNLFFKFQRDFSYEDRKQECTSVMLKHPFKIPVICELHPKDINYADHPPLGKCKYLVSESLTIAQFTQVIRNKIKLAPNIAIFILINGQMPNSSQTMNTLYYRYKNTDGFLYVMYCFENVFG